jgi:sugar lactone lactonase YvrE
MRFNPRMLSGSMVATIATASSVGAQARTEITINDTNVSPESVTSSRDGTAYFGSTAKGTIYRAAPGASGAEPWILGPSTGLTNVLGVLADDRSNTLWVCQNSTGGRGGAPVVGQTAVRTFDLKSGAAKGTYPLPSPSGICNDIAIGPDGSAYVSESFRGRVHRLRPGAAALEVWFTDTASINAIDGLAFLADGALYVNDFFNGKLFRIPVDANGSAGAIVPIDASLPSTRPDGLRAAGPRTLIQAEGQGRVTELTINGNRAEVRVVKDGLSGATGVTVVGDTAFVLMSRTKAVAVPYRPQQP